MATYRYNKANVLKLRVMNVLAVRGALKRSNEALTCKEISLESGVPSQYVSRLMSRCKKSKLGYFRRLQPTAGREYRYQITAKGIFYYTQYIKRFYLGFDLNCKRAQPKQINHYVGAQTIDVKTLAGKKLPSELLIHYIGTTKPDFKT